VKAIVAQRDPQDTRAVVLAPQDEGRFGRINLHRPCWAPKGIRPVAPRQIVRKYVYVFEPVCAALGKMTALIFPFVNIDMVNIFFQDVSQDFKDFFVIMIVDQAPWHTSKRLNFPENLRLIAQPSHSPELNPVEHIWEEIREKAMPNTAFKSLAEVEQALCQELVALENAPDRLRSMTNFPHLRFTF
jgi:hypothetical protein